MNSNNNYNFRIGRIDGKHSRAEIIASLQEFSRVHNIENFRMKDYDAWNIRIVSSGTIKNAFGSWAKALQAAGLRAKKCRNLDFKQMVDAFKACWKQHDSVPTQKRLTNFLALHKYPFRYISYKSVYGGLSRLAKMIVEVQKGLRPESELYQRINKKPKRRAIRLEMRYSVLKRDNYTCVKCGKSPNKDKNVTLEVDHKVPVAKNGQTILENLQTLCLECNQGKKDRED